MNLVFEIDRNRLVDAATGAQVSSLQFAYPDKYPLSISVSKGNQPFVFSGNVYVTLKPASSPLSAPLALLTVPVNSSSTVSGVLDTHIQEMDDFLPAANKRAAAFEVLVVAPSATTEVSVSVNAQISRRYNSVDQPGVTVAEKSLATQAEAEAGTNNTKWMSPLRVSQAISALANPLDDTDDLSEGTTNLYFTEARAKSAVADELSEIGSDITELTGKTGQLETDLSSEAAARAAGDASLSGGLNDLISALSTESQTRAAADSSLAGGLAAEASTRAAADAALGQRIDFLASNLDPAALDSIAEAAASIGSLQNQIDGKAPTSHTHPISQVTGLSDALDSKQPTGNYVTRDQVQTGGSSYFERSANAASQNVGQGQSIHQIVLNNDTRLTDARRVQWFPAPATPGTVPNAAAAGSMAYDGSFLYLLVSYSPPDLPAGFPPLLRWARTPLSMTW
jgi:hypothetical protein